MSRSVASMTLLLYLLQLTGWWSATTRRSRLGLLGDKVQASPMQLEDLLRQGERDSLELRARTNWPRQEAQTHSLQGGIR
jgi:hypothetical protein